MDARVFAFALIALAACSPAPTEAAERRPAPGETAEPAPGEAFIWAASFDPSGYYLPNGTQTAGGWVVDHIFLPMAFEFEDWRAAGADPAEIPVWLEAYPVGSEPEINALGREYHPDAVRVRPDRFVLEDGRFEFAADGGPLGGVLISGQIQPEFLQGESGTPQDGAPALVGGMEIGGDRIRNLSFMHWHGD